MKRKHSDLQGILCILFLVAAIVLAAYVSEQSKECRIFSYINCPGRCVVCPPCEVCSSVSCQTEEFCKTLGFNRSWHDEIKYKLVLME